MEYNDHEWHDEEDCKLAGGPWDGKVLAMKRGWTDYAFQNYAVQMFESQETTVKELDQRAADGETLSEDDVLDHFDAKSDEDRDQAAKPGPGGHLYRRASDGRTFDYVGPISIEETRKWSKRNCILPKRCFADEKMYWRQFEE